MFTAHLSTTRWRRYYQLISYRLIRQWHIKTETRMEIDAWTSRWRHNGCDSVSNHKPHHCLLNRLFRRRTKKTPKLRVTGLCAGNSPGTGEFPAQMASYAENVSIWWRHHEKVVWCLYGTLSTPVVIPSLVIGLINWCVILLGRQHPLLSAKQTLNPPH